MKHRCLKCGKMMDDEDGDFFAYCKKCRKECEDKIFNEKFDELASFLQKIKDVEKTDERDNENCDCCELCDLDAVDPYPLGWVCPKCDTVMSPYSPFCIKCSGGDKDAE